MIVMVFITMQIKKLKASIIDNTQQQLSVLVSAIVHSSATLWREIVTQSRDYVQMSAIAYTL